MSALPAHPIGLIGSGIFCLIMAVIFILKGLVPRWRNTWGWGRGAARPISILGHLGISIGFLFISIGSFASYYKIHPNIAFFLILAGGAIIIFTGVLDTFGRK